jgi:hypothetical protein
MMNAEIATDTDQVAQPGMPARSRLVTRSVLARDIRLNSGSLWLPFLSASFVDHSFSPIQLARSISLFN